LYEDNNRIIWLGKGNEDLLYFDTLAQKFIPFRNPVFKKYQQSTTGISAMYEDRNGSLWFGSHCNGLFYTNATKNKFQHLYHDYVRNNQLPNSIVTSILVNEQDVWIGTENGLAQYNTNSHRIHSYTTQQGLSSNHIQDLKSDENGNCWIATWAGGLMQLTFQTKKIVTYKHDPKNSNSLIYNNIKSIALQDSLIWIGTHGEGLCAYHKKTNRFIHHLNNKEFPFNMREPGWINHLFIDSKNRLWIGAYGGLFRWDGKEMKAFRADKSPRSLSNPDVNMIAEDSEGIIWIATEAGGLNQFHESTENFTQVKSLPSTIKAIQVDQENNVWISGNNGLYCYNKKKDSFIHYTTEDGLQGNEFFLKSTFRDKNGILYMGGTSGLSLFHPKKIKAEENTPTFYFTELEVFERESDNSGVALPQKIRIFQTGEVNLLHHESFFTVHFSLIELPLSSNTRFAYQLSGLTNDWIELGQARKITFTELPPGSYQLKMKHSLKNGAWKELPQVLTITIAPPWWQTWWFRSLIALALATIVWLVYYIRTRSIQLRNAELQQEVMIRTKELSERNSDLMESNEEIRLQKEQLEAYNEEVVRQSDKILTQQELILDQNRELEKVVEKLSLSDQTKNLFFTILAHDLKGPVGAIESLSKTLEENLANLSTEEIKEFSKHIKKSSTSVRQLIFNLLDWARAQSHYLDYQPKDLNILDFVHRSAMLYQQACAQKKIQLRLQIDPNHTVLADSNMLDTIVRNVLGNAVKYAPPGGEVKIETSIHKEQVQLRISDNGIGMTEQEVQDLFQLDKRIQSKGKGDEKGTGLGLILVKEFIEINRGSIEVSSLPGKGSTFTLNVPKSKIVLPASENLELEASTQEAEAEILISQEQFAEMKGHRILLVEDNLAMRNLLRHQLSSTFEIQETENGSEALRMASELQPTVIITDVEMPVMDGLELCRVLKKDPATSHIPVIILTSHDDERSKLSGYFAGADIYLTKPAKKELLLQVIYTILKSRDLLRKELFVLSNTNLNTVNLPDLDKQFLNSINTFIEENLSDQSLEVNHLVRHLGMSRSVLYAKFKAINGLGVNEYIRQVRLRKSRELLTGTSKSISEIADTVGFNSASYFIRCFVKEYECTPGDFRSKLA
jgi:signal transduction histidine kinase/CheY-like chemotaxis protein/AraC-like DNA-binding protein/streptogramin lyase